MKHNAAACLTGAGPPAASGLCQAKGQGLATAIL